MVLLAEATKPKPFVTMVSRMTAEREPNISTYTHRSGVDWIRLTGL